MGADFLEREWARMFARMDANLDVDRADFLGTRMGADFLEREWARMFARMDANLDVDRTDFLERGWAQIFWNANGRECLREWTRI
jgi:hypothetical protein